MGPELIHLGDFGVPRPFFSGLHRIRPIIASNETNFVCNFWVGCAYRAADMVHELGDVLKKCLIAGSSEHSESSLPWLLERSRRRLRAAATATAITATAMAATRGRSRLPRL